MDESSPDKCFSVIQFMPTDGEDQGSVAIVNRQWMTPRSSKVYWPPVKSSKAFDRLLVDNSASPDDKWRLCGIQRIFHETNSLKEAKRKLKLSEIHSDLEIIEPVNEEKRPIKRNKKYVSETDTEDEHDMHTRPPPVKKTFLKNLSTKGAMKRPVIDLHVISKDDNKDVNPHVISKGDHKDDNLYIISKEDNKDDNPDVDNISNFHVFFDDQQHLNILSNSDLQGLDETETILTAENPSASLSLQPKSLTGFDEINSDETESQEISLQSTSTLQRLDETILTAEKPSASLGMQPKLTACSTFGSSVLGMLAKLVTQNNQILAILNNNRTDATLNKEFSFPITNENEVARTEDLLSKTNYYDNLVQLLHLMCCYPYIGT